MHNSKPQFKVPLLYALFGLLWIFLSDRTLELFVSDAYILGQVQTVKGWIYVAMTTILLYLIINRDYNKLVNAELEKRNIFNATLFTVNHILNNFLNQMMLFKLEAENSRDFESDVLVLYDEVIEETETQLRSLEKITDLTEEQIRQVVLRVPEIL